MLSALLNELVRRVGLEPTTSAMSRRHSNQLSYPRNSIVLLYIKQKIPATF